MTLWTPEGEHPVDREPQRDPPQRELSEEEQTRLEAMAEEMAEVRRQLAEVPAATVVANHVMGLGELASIHLGRTPPAFDEAALAIDAMGAVIDNLGGRLGENQVVLRGALDQIRMAFVQLKSRSEGGESEGTTPS